MAGVPFAAASSGPGAIVATLRFNPVPDEDMLPEARKEIADAMWETIVQNGVDCIFDQEAACSRGVRLHGSAPLNRSRGLATDKRSWS